MKTVFKILVAICVLAVRGYWYASPYLAVHSMKNAAQALDADDFNKHVDYPALRESIKGQLVARMEQAQREIAGDKPGSLEQAGAAFGSMLALSLVDRFVDAMVRPEFVMRAMAEAKLRTPGDTAPAIPASAPPASTRTEVEWTFERQGFDRFFAYGSPKGSADDTQRTAFVFARTGFANWRLTGVQLPASPAKAR